MAREVNNKPQDLTNVQLTHHLCYPRGGCRSFLLLFSFHAVRPRWRRRQRRFDDSHPTISRREPENTGVAVLLLLNNLAVHGIEYAVPCRLHFNFNDELEKCLVTCKPSVVVCRVVCAPFWAIGYLDQVHRDWKILVWPLLFVYLH